jgi:hypothetical protein
LDEVSYSEPEFDGLEAENSSRQNQAENFVGESPESILVASK